jgi:VWFA-related protein
MSSSRKFRCWFAFALIGGLSGLALIAQQDTEPVLRVTSRLIQVSVVAQDKNGNPVRDLTRDDFTISDDNHPQKISVFSLDVAEPVTVATPRQGLTASGGIQAPLVVANRALEPEEKRMGVTVIVLDALNLGSTDDFVYARKQLLEFLKTLQPGDPVALYSINGPQVLLIHDFTDDASDLIQVARTLSSPKIDQEAGASPVTFAGDPSMSNIGGDPHFAAIASKLMQASQADAATKARITTEWTFTALESIARHLTGIPGRKNMIWISSGYPMNIGLNPEAFAAASGAGVNQELFGYSDRTDRIARLLAEAEVVVYPVDPGGVRTDHVYRASNNGRPSNGRFITAGEKAAPQTATIRAIARQTGGIAYVNNAIAKNIREAVDDGRITYTIGFYPSQAAWDGKYHSLKVTVNRPGVEVRTRAGYFAKSIAELPPEREHALRLAVSSPLEGEAIGVKVTVPSNPLGWASQDLAVTIDPRDLRFEAKDGRMQSGVDVVFAQQAQDGHIVKGEQKAISFNLTPDKYQDGMKNGLALPEKLWVERDASRVHVVVRDTATGAVGSVSVPIRRTAQP